MNLRRLIFFGGLLLVAVLLAPIAFAFFEGLVIEPLSYLGWVIRLILRALPQANLWYFLVGLMFLVALGSMIRNAELRFFKDKAQAAKKGPVEALAQDISHSKRGAYFKWVVANRLAKLAQATILQGGNESAGRPHQLQGQGWSPPDKVQSYLEAGLRDSIIQYARRSLFKSVQNTPFDVDINQVIEYLESQTEWTER
jgi:hypothetical protein